jgi:hypothetical protein
MVAALPSGVPVVSRESSPGYFAGAVFTSVLCVYCSAPAPVEDGSGGTPGTGEQPSGDADAGGRDPGNWPADVPPPEEVRPDTEPPAEPCGPENPEQVWSFDDSAGEWRVTIDGAHAFLQWTNAGLLQIDVLPDGDRSWTAQAELDAELGDLNGKELASTLYVENNLVANVFVRSRGESSFDFWANGDWTEVPGASWSCLVLAVDSPDYAGADFDASDVTGIGVHFEGTGPARAFVDMVRY